MSVTTDASLLQQCQQDWQAGQHEQLRARVEASLNSLQQPEPLLTWLIQSGMRQQCWAMVHWSCGLLLHRHPGHPVALLSQALAYMGAARPEPVLAVLQQLHGTALAEPQQHMFWDLYSRACMDLGRLEEALHAVQQRLLIPPGGNREIRQSIAALLRSLGRFDAAAAMVQQAIAHDDGPMAVFERALVRLGQGQLATGWQDYETRFVLPSFQTNCLQPTTPCPRWQPAAQQQALLLLPEQGLGDQLLALGCLPDVLAQTDEVVVSLDERLHPALARRFPAITLLPAEPARVEHCIQTHAPGHFASLPMSSLPYFFRRSLADFSHHSGVILSPDPERTRHWTAWLHSQGRGPFVGLSWRSGLMQQERSFYHSDCRSLLQHLPGRLANNWVSLQYDMSAAEKTHLQQHGVLLPPESLDLRHDLDEVIALISALDGVISSGSCVADLAACVGVPLYLLFPARHWKMLGTHRYPWYPTTRVVLDTKQTGMPATLGCLRALEG